jgi:hypothetical protein
MRIKPVTMLYEVMTEADSVYTQDVATLRLRCLYLLRCPLR